MNLLNVLPRAEGSVGEIRKVGKFSYLKAKNGKWGLVYDKPVLELLSSLHKKGMTNQQIAEHTGIPRPRITTVLKNLGLARNPERAGQVERSLQIYADPEVQTEILHLYGHRHFPCWLIAHALNVGERTVIKFLKASVGIRSNKEAQVAYAKRTGRPTTYLPHARAIHRHANATFTSFDDYTHAARRLTDVLRMDYERLVDPEGLRSYFWHMDHQFSIYLGYFRYSAKRGKFVPRRKPIPLQVLCHPANLKVISASENAIKGTRAAIRYGKLLRRIEEFDSIFGPVFKDFDYAEEWERLSK